MRSARGLLLAIVLGPRAFGIWTLFRIFMRYTPLSGLGVQRGLELEIVQERALGDAEAIARSDSPRAPRSAGSSPRRSRRRSPPSIASFIVTDPTWRIALRAVSLGVVLEELLGVRDHVSARASRAADATRCSRSRTRRCISSRPWGWRTSSDFAGRDRRFRHRRAREPVDGSQLRALPPGARTARSCAACSTSAFRSRSRPRSRSRSAPRTDWWSPRTAAPRRSASTRSASRSPGSRHRSRGSSAR